MNNKINGIAAYGVVLGIFCLTMVNNMDRVNISIVAPMMIQEYGWDMAALGIVFSVFNAGYFLMQMPMGWLADKFGPRRILAGSAFYWAIMTLLSTLPSNIYALSAIRAGLGAGEAANFPGQTSFIARHLPRRLVGRIQAFNFSGTALGPFVATPLCVYFSTSYGWRYAFYVAAALSFIIGIYWLYVTKKANMMDSAHNEVKKETFIEKKSGLAIFENPFREIEVWGFSISWFANAYVFSFIVMWLPMYLVKGRGMSVADMAIFGSVPWAFLFVMMNVAGYIVDWVKNSTKHNIFWRRMIYACGYLVCAAFTLMMQTVETSQMAVIYICGSFAGLAFTWPVSFALPIEYAGSKAGITTGFMQTWGVSAGIISPLITGAVAQRGDWGQAFWWAAVFAIAGVVVVLATSRYNTGVAISRTMTQSMEE